MRKWSRGLETRIRLAWRAAESHAGRSAVTCFLRPFLAFPFLWPAGLALPFFLPGAAARLRSGGGDASGAWAVAGRSPGASRAGTVAVRTGSRRRGRPVRRVEAARWWARPRASGASARTRSSTRRSTSTWAIRTTIAVAQAVAAARAAADQGVGPGLEVVVVVGQRRDVDQALDRQLDEAAEQAEVLRRPMITAWKDSPMWPSR